MLASPVRRKRIAVGATTIVAVGISCLGIARVQHFVVPDGGVGYTCSSGKACVEGSSTGTPYGVYGTSSGGNGVEGKSSAAGRSGISGVQLGSSGIGVYAESHDTSAKYAALLARGDETSTNIFYGYNEATHSSCLIDPNSNLTCKGSIEGAPSQKLVGVMGNSTEEYGVEGVSYIADGVYGTTNSTTGNSGVAGVAQGTSGTAYGVSGTSGNGPGVYGDSTPSYGVEGVSTDSDGVFGTTSSGDGVYGKSSNGVGVYGESNERSGVYGYSATVAGVVGSTNAAGEGGVLGESRVGDGVVGEDGTTSAAGVLGIDFGGGSGTLGESQTGAAVAAIATGSGALIFDGEGPGASPASCKIDSGANLSCSGEITGGGSQTRHRTSSGRHVLSFASESTSSTIEDFGTGSMLRGAAEVEIEPTFASTIDRDRPYYVFLTPLGDTRGLYVSRKTPSSFEVRETQGGRSNLSFDYRIVAHPADAQNGRLPQAPASSRRAIHIHVPAR